MGYCVYSGFDVKKSCLFPFVANILNVKVTVERAVLNSAWEDFLKKFCQW